MDIKNFLDEVCSKIKYKPAHKLITEELEEHVKEIKEAYIKQGISEKEAEEKAVLQMGNADEIGKKLNKVHRPKLDWKLLVLVEILIGFGFIVSTLKNMDSSVDYQKFNFLYIIAGIGIGVFIYFLDYKKVKKYSNLMYILATMIMIYPLLVQGTINGVRYMRIFNISFMPCMVAIPFYMIAFAGYITNYDSNKKIAISVFNKEIFIKQDFTKILLLSVLSIVFMLQIPSIINAITLGLGYFMMTTVKIKKDCTKPKQKIAILYGIMFTIIAVFLLNVYLSPYRFTRITASFSPELDPNGSGYIGMQQKEIIKNAKWIGKAEIPLDFQSFIVAEGSYTFIYLLARLGILFSAILLLTILCTSIKLIYDAKKIKEPYGKFLIIGFATTYIFQSIASVLMNLNLGIQFDVNIPFVAYGAVYFLVNMISIAIIFSVYRRKDINIYDKEENYPKTILQEVSDCDKIG